MAQSTRSGNVAAPMNTPQGGQSFDNTGYATIGDAYAASVPALGQTFGDDVVNRAGANGGGYGLNDDEKNNVNEGDSEKDRAWDTYKEYFEHAINGDEDAYLDSLGYREGIMGYRDLYYDVLGIMGVVEFEKRKEQLNNPALSATISAGDGEKVVSNPADYYVNPDEYDSDDEYNEALLKGLRHQMQNGNPDAFLLENGYSSGGQGIMALNNDVKEALGELGYTIYAEELNDTQAAKEAELQQNIAALRGDDVPTMEEVKAVLKEENEYYIDRDDYASNEEYQDAILQTIAYDVKQAKEILKANGVPLPSAKETLDTELYYMHPRYVRGSLKIIDGPFDGTSGFGIDDIIRGTAGILEGEAVTEGFSVLIPETSYIPYEWYIVSADFDLSGGVENEIFQVNLYQNGASKMFWREVEYENY